MEGIEIQVHEYNPPIVTTAKTYDTCQLCSTTLRMDGTPATFEVSGHFSMAYAMPDDHTPEDHRRETTGGGEVDAPEDW